MVKFEELEQKIQQSKANYSLSDDGRGEKSYTIFSEELRGSLRDTIHKVVREKEGWQISHTFGEDFVEYRKEQDGKFALYQKSMVENSPDKFVVLSEDRSLIERESFKELEELTIRNEQLAVENEQLAVENEQLAVENEQSRQDSKDNYISFSTTWNKEGKIVERKIEEPVDPAKKQAVQESWGYKAIKGAFSILKQEEEKGNKEQNDNQQQAQILQGEQLKIAFFGEKK